MLLEFKDLMGNMGKPGDKRAKAGLRNLCYHRHPPAKAGGIFGSLLKQAKISFNVRGKVPRRD